jgi:transcriptional regulator with PAS, ATPase and Fis domain
VESAPTPTVKIRITHPIAAMSLVRRMSVASYLVQLAHADYADFHSRKIDTSSSPLGAPGDRIRKKQNHERDRSPRPRVSATTTEAARVAWAAENLNGHELAERFGVSRTSAYRWIHEWRND